ncbi:hypothetical protein M422DRAFT_43119 [Sphaerobolus stellatus SS14]|nr:hypothetical protein M422DRAFT_43119 [Sphaerobolus stellatus SS14]
MTHGDMATPGEERGTHAHLNLDLAKDVNQRPQGIQEPIRTTLPQTAGRAPSTSKTSTGIPTLSSRNQNTGKGSSSIGQSTHGQQRPTEREQSLQGENDALRARLALIEEEWCMAAQSSGSGQPSPFITDEEFERLRSRTAVSGEQEDSKGSIPDMVPGFKASPLTIVVSRDHWDRPQTNGLHSVGRRASSDGLSIILVGFRNWANAHYHRSAAEDYSGIQGL